MLFSLSYGIYISLLTLLCGILLDRICYQVFDRRKTQEPPPFVRTFLLGITGLSVAVAIVAWFRPIDIVTHLLLVTSLLIGTVMYRIKVLARLNHYFERIRKHKFVALLLGLVYLCSISEASGLVSIGDSGYYHIPLVKWLDEYGLVKGLANLQDTLGFMSGWFYYAALFDFGMFTDLTYHVLNALAWCWGWLMVAGMILRFKEGRYGMNDYLIIPLVLFLITKVDFIASLSPELIGPLMVFWVIHESLELSEREEVAMVRLLFLFLFAAFCVFLKLTLAPVMLFLILPVINYWKGSAHVASRVKLASLLKISLPAITLLIVFAYQNAMLSGYLLYPFSAVDVLEVEWKVPENEVKSLVRHIEKYGIDPGYHEKPETDYTGFSWIGPWLERNLNSREAPETVGFLLLPLSVPAGIFLLYMRRSRLRVSNLLFNYLLFVTCIVVWFLSSPQPRLATIWIFSTLFFPFAILLKGSEMPAPKWLQTVLSIGALLLVGWLGYFILRTEIVSHTIGKKKFILFWLRDINTPEYREVKIADETVIHVPLESAFLPRIYNMPLPSSGHELEYRGRIDTAIERRGSTLSEGFKPSQ